MSGFTPDYEKMKNWLFGFSALDFVEPTDSRKAIGKMKELEKEETVIKFMEVLRFRNQMKRKYREEMKNL
jgi:hypothetical protein